jgi:hypothetical protein
MTAAVVAVGLTVGGVSLASSLGPANDSQPMVINALSRATSINNFIDTGPAGFSPGDLYVFEDHLFSATASGDQIGTSDGRCVLIDPSTLKFDCSITNELTGAGGLPAGDLMASGLLALSQGATSHFAVVGGTDAYRNARGDAKVVLGPLEGPHEVTVNLILNP